MKPAELKELVGKTLCQVNCKAGDDQADFLCDGGELYAMKHDQDCCERVYIEDVCGDVADLIGQPIVRAEEASSVDGFDEKKGREHHDDSFTWTFYIIGTAKGTVTIRWYGESNGYYSERVDFVRVA